MQTNSACQYVPISAVCAQEPNIPMAPFAGCFPIVSGEVDLDWADKSESRLDRVVGSIGLKYRTIITQPDNFVWPDVRLGMLVVEEVENIVDWIPPNLWDHDHIEEFEWMWLCQRQALAFGDHIEVGDFPQVGSFVFGAYDQDVDIRVRRKLGKQDWLILVVQFANGIDAAFDISVQYVPMLRCVFVN